MSSAFSQHLLLVGSNPNVPLGPFDGKVAAVINDFVCTTPNQNQIFLPPMQKREVHQRADFRYGPDDPTLWPQPWIIQYPHLGAIPKKPDDSKDPLSIMWWDPTRDDFEFFEGSLVDGLGELSKPKLQLFEATMKGLEIRVEEYKQTCRISDPPNAYLASMTKAMRDAYIRLASLKTTFSEMRFGVTEFQRYFLEARGCLDYIVLFKPRMDGLSPAATTIANCIGVVTNIPNTVQDFHTAGLPVWFLRPQKSWESPISCNILKVVTPLVPADILCVREYDPPFPPIYRGSMIKYQRHAAIHSHSQNWLVFKDPFKGRSSKVSEPSTIQARDHDKSSLPERSQSTTRGASSSTERQTTQVSGRNKFLPLESPFAPFSIPAWSAGLQAVDQSPSHLIEPSKTSKHYGHYVFPDPGLFITPAADEKKAQRIVSWLRVRDTWCMRLAKESSLALSNQNWRTFLTVDLDVPAKGGTKAANRRREILDSLVPKSVIYPELKIRSAFNGPLVWQGKDYSAEMLPPEHVVRQILWELYELNFIHELLSLDRRACSDLDLQDTAQLLERQMKISQCFPFDSFRHVIVASENRGLAADSFNERFRFVIALFLVMKSWKGEQPTIFGTSEENVRGFSREAAGAFENLVAKYYCQQFFNYFGRAAQIPHRLFPTQVN